MMTMFIRKLRKIILISDTGSYENYYTVLADKKIVCTIKLFASL